MFTKKLLKWLQTAFLSHTISQSESLNFCYTGLLLFLLIPVLWYPMFFSYQICIVSVTLMSILCQLPLTSRWVCFYTFYTLVHCLCYSQMCPHSSVYTIQRAMSDNGAILAFSVWQGNSLMGLVTVTKIPCITLLSREETMSVSVFMCDLHAPFLHIQIQIL